MKLYKYLKRDYARNFMTKGEVYIGTLAFYRGIEDESRADGLEGKKEIVVKITETKTITNKEEWEKELPHLKGSNINYERGTVIVPPGEHRGNDDTPDSYIYCMSQVQDDKIKAKFGADCCIEVFDVQLFLNLIDIELVKLELIYPGVSSGRAIEYIGHEVPEDFKISGNWLKRESYKDEVEFRFSFIPVIKKDGTLIQPTINEDKSVEFSRDFDTIDIKPMTIKINPKEIAKCCRWR